MSIKAVKRDCMMYFEYNSSWTIILIIKTDCFGVCLRTPNQEI